MNDLMTVGDIARYFGRDVYKINYVIKSRSIEPQGKVGGLRVFDEATRDRIGSILDEIDEKQPAAGRSCRGKAGPG